MAAKKTARSRANSKKNSTKSTKKSKVASRSTTKSSQSLAHAMAESKTRSTATSSSMNPMTGLTELALMFVAFFAVHTLVLFLGDLFLGDMVVLGHHIFSPLRGLIQSMLFFTVLVVAAVPVIEVIANSLRVKLGMMHWIGVYLVINSIALWATARMAEMLGMGISGWEVVVGLAAVITLAQGLVSGMVLGSSKK